MGEHVCSHALHERRGGNWQIDACRHRQQPIFRHQPVLGVHRAQRADVGHAVAGPKGADMLANRQHCPGRLDAGNQRQAHREGLAGAVLQIDKVHADGSVAHQHLRAAGRGQADLAQLHDLRPTVLINTNRSHTVFRPLLGRVPARGAAAAWSACERRATLR